MSENFRTEVEQVIKLWIKYLEKLDDKDISKVKQVTKYTNHRDFWYGYMLGTMEGQILQAFDSRFGRNALPEEKFEIEEIIELNNKKLLEIILKKKS